MITLRRQPGLLIGGFLLALLTTMLTSGQTPAAAAGATCGTKNNYYAVAQSSSYSSLVYGVKANIQRYDPALCSSASGSPSVSAAWAMLIPQTPLTQYAQAGYVKVGTNNPDYPSHTGLHEFAQYTYACAPNCGSGNPNAATAWGPTPPTGSTTYSVFLRASDDRIVMQAAGSTLLVMNRDISGEWSTGWGGQFGGETFHTASDIPGVDTNHVIIDNIQNV